jgi:hypothetical protein
MWALAKSRVRFRTLLSHNGSTECWQSPRLPQWEVPERDPHERRPRAPNCEPGAAAEIVVRAAPRVVGESSLRLDAKTSRRFAAAMMLPHRYIGRLDMAGEDRSCRQANVSSTIRVGQRLVVME